MLPTLKTTHKTQLKQKLDKYKKNPELLREVIDQRMVDEMDRSLNKLSDILKAPEFETLSSLHFSLQKAHNELSNVLGYGDIRKWAHSLLPKGFTSLGRLTAFTAGVTNLFRQLPKLVNTVKGSMDAERRAEWDPNKPLDTLLDSGTAQKLSNIIIIAMKPPAGLGGLSIGLPYVKDETLATEILGLSFNQLLALSNMGRQVEPPKVQQRAAELGQDIKAVAHKGPVEEPSDEPKQKAQPKQPKEPEAEAEPVEKPAQKLSIPGAEPEREVPTVAEADAAIKDVFDETSISMFGERGLSSKLLKELKPKLTRNILIYMLKNGLIKRVSR